MMEYKHSRYGYPYTPIRIKDGIVLAWVWNGWERSGGMLSNPLPVFRLKKPKKRMWRNGRILTLPFRSSYVTVGDD